MSDTTIDSAQLAEVAEFIAGANSVLEKHAKLDATFGERIPQVVDLLVKQGLLNENLKAAKVRELTEDPTKLVGELEKLAAQVAAKPMGQPASNPTAPAGGKMRESDERYVAILTGNE